MPIHEALEGRYRIERELGAGGMATVYLAHDARHERQVAIKVLRPELAAVIGAQRFLREIRTIANLQHPHILGLIDSGEVDGTAYYVMPFVSGESLRDRLDREKQLPIFDAVRIAGEVASALDYAHRHGVIHRDIKPENILLHDGRAMVADFGIALAVSNTGATRITETGMSLGTPHYMSPEQAMGERDITARSDVYALGATTYEMLVGDPPFTGSTAQAIVARVVTETPRPLTAQRHTIPPHVEQAVLTALEKLPADRFATAAEFAHALTTPGSADSHPPSSRGRKAAAAIRSPSHPWLAFATIALIALTLGALAATLLSRPGTDVRTTRLLLDFPGGQRPRLSASQLPMLALAPDGGGLVYSGPGTAARTQLWIRSWERVDAERLTPTVDDGCCAVFSPGGDSIAYLVPPHALHVIPLASGIAHVALDSGLIPVSDFGGGVDWASDGMLYTSGTAGLLRVSPRGGQVEVVAPIDTARGHLYYAWPAVLPGARAALVSVVVASAPFAPEATSIGVADFDTGEVTVILQGTRARYSPTGHVVFARTDGVLHVAPFDARGLRVTGTPVALPDTLALRLPSLGDFALAGGTLAYSRGVVESFDAMWVDRSGNPAPIAADLTAETMDGPTLSPDGRQLVIALAGPDRRYGVWLRPLDGAEKTRLTFDEYLNWRAVWRPDGERLYFLSNRHAPGFRLYDMDPRRPGTMSRTAVPEPRALGGVAWSPDGSWLLLRTDDQEPGRGDIVGFRPEVDTAVRALVATPAEELAPEISPDGQWMAYTSNHTGQREVYVRPFPETDGGVFQVSANGGITPAWNPAGGELFYLDGAGRMIAVALGPGPGFQMSGQRALFDASDYQQNPFVREYEITRDGRRFIMIRGEAGEAVSVAVVFEFEESLR